MVTSQPEKRSQWSSSIACNSDKNHENAIAAGHTSEIMHVKSAGATRNSFSCARVSRDALWQATDTDSTPFTAEETDIKL